MPDLPNRGDAEARLADAISGAHQVALIRIREQLGDPPDEYQLTDAFWLGIMALYVEALKQPLQDVFLAAVDGMNAEFSQTLNLDTQAAEWADMYSQSLAALLVANRRAFVVNAIHKSNDEQMTVDEFIAYLSLYFGIDNAVSIAITETTSAMSEAEKQYSMLLKLMTGILLTPVVRNDFDPCDECIDKVDKNPNSVGYPPYHQKCRCYCDWTMP